jgi:hypothetical protein
MILPLRLGAVRSPRWRSAANRLNCPAGARMNRSKWLHHRASTGHYAHENAILSREMMIERRCDMRGH